MTEIAHDSDCATHNEPAYPNGPCDCSALTPRHEAPAETHPDDMMAPDQAWQNLCEKDDRTSPEDYPDMCLISFDELAGYMRDALPAEAPADKDPVPSEWTGHGTDDGFFKPAKTAFSKEAPAEGAGETDEAFCEAYYDAHLTHAWAALRDGVPYQVNADGAISLIQQAAIDRRALRARSSAPESLGNLLAVIHRDGGHRTLEVGVERAAAEAEKIVADLLSSAPEAREGEAVGWFGDKDYEPTETMIDAGLEHCRPGNYANMIASFKAMMSQAEIDGLVAYAHPAAPIALRIAVEAWEELAKRPSWEVSFSGFDEEDGWSVHRVTGGVNDREWEELSRADTPLEAIEAALQAEGC